MASLSAAAIVISHARKDLLVEVLAGLSQQTLKPTEIVVIETSPDLSSLDLCRQFDVEAFAAENISLNHAINLALSKLKTNPGWYWVLHDDSIPKSDALEKLLIAAETSPSVAVVGPKLMTAGKPGLIQQLGLTVTAGGTPFVLVQDEYDQGQHANLRDVLAVSTAGMLVSGGVWQQLNGLSDNAPTFAHDLDFGIRARAAGFRVIVEPSAEIEHYALSLNSQRAKRWTGGGWDAALAKAETYMAALLLPIWLVIARLLSAPLLALFRIPVHLIRNRPAKMSADFRSWIWSWLNATKLFAARAQLRKLGALTGISGLYATSAQIQLRKESKLDFSASESREQLGLFASQGIWFSLLPILLALPYLPTANALISPKLLVSASSFAEWYQTVRSGVVTDLDGNRYLIDSSSWLHGIFAIISPSSPSFGLAVFLFLVPTISYLGIWKYLALFSFRPGLTTMFALGGSAISAAVVFQSPDLGSVLLAGVLPWLFWSLHRMGISRTSARAWRWVGLSSLLLLIVALVSPIAALAIWLWFLSMGTRTWLVFLQRFVTLVPASGFVFPTLLKLPVANWLEFNQLALGDSELNWQTILLLIPIVLLLSAIGWFFVGAARQVAQIGLALILMGLIFLIPALSAGLLSGAVIALTVLGVLVAQHSRARVFANISTTLATSYFLTVGFWSVWAAPVKFGSEQQVPALVAAAYQAGQDVRTLVLRSNQTGLEAELLVGNGYGLHEASLLKQVAEPIDAERESALALAAAQLSVGQGVGSLKSLELYQISFVLLRESAEGNSAAIAAKLNSTEGLQFAGLTEFGYLYRVETVTPNGLELLPTGDWFALQLFLLGMFALLAIPTPGAIRGTSRLRKNYSESEEN